MGVGAKTAVLLFLACAGCGGGSSEPVMPDSSIEPPDASAVTEPVAADASPEPFDLGLAGDGPATYAIWPGEATVTTVGAENAFGANLSGLVFEPATAATTAILWAVQNEPSKLHRLTWDGSTFTPVTTDGWLTGKVLRYPGGNGSPDSEGVTRTDWASNEVYVAAERDNDNNQTSRQSILRYELSGTKGLLEATHEWVLTSDLPAASSNCGLEGIAWIPDTYLAERGFFDESKQAPYDPARYPNHGSGIFLVSYDESGMLYGYVLDHAASTFTRLATVPSGQPRAVDLTFDRDTGTLWSLCDSACKGRMTLLDIDADPASATAGRFVLRATVSPPRALSDMNNEGIALAPLWGCSGERRWFFWSDDRETNGYAIRRGTIACTRLY